MYIPIKIKFIFTIIIAILWTIVCFIIDKAWFYALVAAFGLPIAIFIVFGIAIIPGVMICFYSICGLLFDRHYDPEIIKDELEDITVLIAAYNEEDCIYDTIKSLSFQEYPKTIIIKVIDNNSKDKTKEEIYRAISDFPQMKIEYLFEPTQGKWAALNSALKTTNTKYYITIDADTYLFKGAIQDLANQITQESKNKNIAACAGCVLVRNSRKNLLTKMQEWEYFLSMATIKRSQGLFQTTMVAQGAFSIYNTELVKQVGGYKNVIGEDIVLSWELLSQPGGWRNYYNDNAIAFTNVPETFKIFWRQRVRWSRGSIEGFRRFKWKDCDNRYTKFYMLVNRINIIGEISTICFLVPGIILALFFHNFLLISWCTVVLFLVTMLIYMIMLHKQRTEVFKPLGLKIRRHYIAFIIYTISYAILLAPMCLTGYIKEILRTKRKWK